MSAHQARKRFGQNFLQDGRIIDSIVSAAVAGDSTLPIVEIGPGLGALTESLLRKTGHVHVVEIDRDLVSRLRQRFSAEQLSIHEADALAFDFSTIGERFKIVGNLPYNISTPLLFHLRKFREHVGDMIFMLQKEVVDRMVAEPGGGDYGRLSVMLQRDFVMTSLFDVPPESFFPVPKVTSSVVRLRPRQQQTVNLHDKEAFTVIVAAAFSMRRKTLRNCLRGYLDESDFQRLAIDSGWRAERLSNEQFVSLANDWVSRKRLIENKT